MELYEYAVEKKPEGNYKTKRILMIALYAVFGLGLAGACIGIGIVPLVAVVPIFVWMLIFFTWRYVSIGYKYAIESGEFRFAQTFGGKAKKNDAVVHLKNAVAFLPLDKAEKVMADFSAECCFDGRPATDATDLYALLINEDGKRYQFVIQATEPSQKPIRYYLPLAVKQNGVLSEKTEN